MQATVERLARLFERTLNLPPRSTREQNSCSRGCYARHNFKLGLTERRDTPEAMKLPLLYGVTHALKRWKEGCLKGGDGDEARHTGIGPPRGE